VPPNRRPRVHHRVNILVPLNRMKHKCFQITTQQFHTSSRRHTTAVAYRCGHSIETALLWMLNDIYLSADNGLKTMLLQVDLSSAFDTLLCRLRYTFGVSSQAFNWVSSYSVHSSQSVRV